MKRPRLERLYRMDATGRAQVIGKAKRLQHFFAIEIGLKFRLDFIIAHRQGETVRRSDAVDDMDAVTDFRNPCQFALDIVDHGTIGLEHLKAAAHRVKVTAREKRRLPMIRAVADLARMGQVAVIPRHPRITVGGGIKLIIRPVIHLAFYARLNPDDANHSLPHAENIPLIAQLERPIGARHVAILREHFISVMTVHDRSAITAHHRFRTMSGERGQWRSTGCAIECGERLAHALAFIACWRMS